MSNAVWITGLGATTPIGNDFSTITRRLFNGESAAQFIVDHNADGPLRLPACLLDEVPVPPSFAADEFRALSPVEQAVLWASDAALRDAGWAGATDGLRIGLIFGNGGEWLREWPREVALGAAAPLYTGHDPENLVKRIQTLMGLNGPTASIAAACASANYAFALGRQWIKRGIVDVCIAGGGEIITPLARAAFNNLRALSRRSDDARLASRPFDRDREGFVMSEGAAMLLLESEASARRRGARVYGELAGFGASSDASHMIIPSDDPAPVSLAIRGALAAAQVDPAEVSYVNAHATGTPVGDIAETRALHHVFGERVKTLPVSSTKSITGHMLSAAAGVEAIAGLAAIAHQTIPPTINLDNPDPACDLNHVRHHAISAPVNVVVSNSFGFGGNNTSLVLRRVA